jgi:hypothetical protein
MRTAGDVAIPEGLSAHDHLCWVFDDAADFHRRATRFLAEGVAQGLAGVWVGTKPHDDLAAELAGLDVATLERSGELSILALPATREEGDGPDDPRAQAAFWEDWTRQVISAGFRGLRAAGDTSEWVRRPEEQAVHLAYEAALDHVTRRVPLSVMCAFDRSRLGADVAAAFAELHPLVSPGAAPFQVHLADEHDLALRGEVDLSDAVALRRTLEFVVPAARPGELHLDARDLRSIDHRGLLELDRFATERRARLVLHGADATCAREMVGLLDLAHVRVADDEPAGDGRQAPRGGGPGARRA